MRWRSANHVTCVTDVCNFLFPSRGMAFKLRGMNGLRYFMAACVASLLLCAGCDGRIGGGGNGPGMDASPDAPVSTGPDQDGDGLPDADEVARGTDPAIPDSDGDGLSDGDEVNRGTDPLKPDTDGDGIPDGDEVDIGTDPTDPNSNGCAGSSAEATLTKRPADIIIMIDTSGSMGGEADQVELRINNDLAGVLESNDVDYRIIMVADFPPDDGGDATDPTLCIGPPLTTQDCSNLTSSKPINGDRFFHYDTHVNSTDALVVAVDEFADPLGDEGQTSGAGQITGGWGTLLRPGSLKFFVVISDDDSEDKSAADFDTEIKAAYAAMYPDAGPLEYVFQSIIGIAANPDSADAAWPASEPIEADDCGTGAVNNGAVYQELSIATGGIRFPLCNNDNFNVIFNAIAGDVAGGVTLPCTYVPDAAGGDNVDLDRSALVFEPGNSTDVESLNRVADPATCYDGAYYREGDAFTLCTATCDRVSQDPAGKVLLRLGCRIEVIE